jgi:hypothetical protein
VAVVRTLRLTRSITAFGAVGLVALAVIVLTLKSPFQARTTFRDDLPTVVEEIRNLSRLETASFRGQKIVEANKDMAPLPSWLVGDRVLLIADGEVTAGVELGRITEREVYVSGGTVHVHLPPAQIFSVRLDDRSYIYDHHPGLFGGVDNDLETEARSDAEEQVRTAALASGLLTRADKNARAVVDSLLKAAGAKAIIFD